MKKLLMIMVMVSLLIGTEADAGIKEWWKNFGQKSTTGCVYDGLDRDIKCITIKWGGDTGKYWNEAVDECVRKTMSWSRRLGYEGQWTGCT